MFFIRKCSSLENCKEPGMGTREREDPDRDVGWKKRQGVFDFTQRRVTGRADAHTRVGSRSAKPSTLFAMPWKTSRRESRVTSLADREPRAGRMDRSVRISNFATKVIGVGRRIIPGRRFRGEV